MATTTPALDFTLFYVSDLDTAQGFFARALNLRPDPQQSGPAFRGFVDQPVGLALADGDARYAGKVELYYKTNDIQTVHSELASKGLDVTAIVERPFGSIFSIGAPDGHLITYLQTPAS